MARSSTRPTTPRRPRTGTAPRRREIEARTAYREDLYTWVEEQVALLRAGRLDAIDAENIAEELADVGKTEYRELQSALAVLLQHLLKWDHQPEWRSRSWANTVREQRRRLLNPGLEVRLAEAVADGYADGRDRASTDTSRPLAAFPADCPYGWEEIIARPIAFGDDEPA
jgi:hypothetical protein